MWRPGRMFFHQPSARHHWLVLVPRAFSGLAAAHVIVILSLLYLVVAVGAVAFEALSARDAAWADARRLSSKTAAVFAERSLRTITATRAILETARTHIIAVGLDEVLHSPEEWRLFHDLALGLPEHGSLWINSPEGDSLLASFTPSPSGVSSAGRDFVTVHSDHRVEFYLGGLIKGRWTDHFIWPMSVGLRDDRGRLTAVIHAAIVADYFTPLLQTADLGENAVMGLYRADGTLLLRQPMTNSLPEENGIKPGWLESDQPVGTLVAKSQIDGVERLYAFRHVPEYDVYAIVGMPTALIDAKWRSHVGGLLEFIVMALAPMIALSLIGLRGARREEVARRALAESNRLLEQRVVERTGEAEAARQAAERANLAKSRFLAAASHDLRQPSQATRLFVDMLREQTGGTPLAGIVDKLHESTVRAEELLATLMTVATLDAGAVQPNREPVPVAQMMAVLHDEWAVQARAKGLILRTVPVRAIFLTDGVMLKRALGNLLANAIRYTQQGGVVFGCRRSSQGFRFEIHDSGPGIASDQLDIIFEDFHQIRSGDKRQSAGLGLGLGIVRRTAQLLGMEVLVRSSLGHGSCFSLLVPTSVIAAGSAQSDEPRQDQG